MYMGFRLPRYPWESVIVAAVACVVALFNGWVLDGDHFSSLRGLQAAFSAEAVLSSALDQPLLCPVGLLSLASSLVLVAGKWTSVVALVLFPILVLFLKLFVDDYNGE